LLLKKTRIKVELVARIMNGTMNALLFLTLMICEKK